MFLTYKEETIKCTPYVLMKDEDPRDFSVITRDVPSFVKIESVEPNPDFRGNIFVGRLAIFLHRTIFKT